MHIPHILCLLLGVLAFVVGSNAIDETTSLAKTRTTTWPGHGLRTTLITSTKSTKDTSHDPTILAGPRHSSATRSSTTDPFPPKQTHPLGIPIPVLIPIGEENSTTTFDPLLARAQKFKCEAGDKLMSYKSARCDGREYYACCPRGWQAAFGEDCVGLPACKYDPKNGKPMREWPGKSPNGCVICADGYAAVSNWYGGCMQEPVPESFKNGKCTGPTGNKCL